MWVSTSPVNALVTEPILSGAGLPGPARSPKPLTNVSPSRTAPMTTAGTLASMKKICPVKST